MGGANYKPSFEDQRKSQSERFLDVGLKASLDGGERMAVTI